MDNGIKNCHNCQYLIWGNSCEFNGSSIIEGEQAENCKDFKEITMNMEFDFLCDTLLHISEVKENLEIMASNLKQRGDAHDRTKLQELEFDAFVSTREAFKKANYGSPEYDECIRLTKPAVEHHYANNRHHVGFHKNGINDMNLMDVTEMVADWKAAARRSPDKKLEDTLDYAKGKYKIDSQLFLIIKNTLMDLGWLTANEE